MPEGRRRDFTRTFLFSYRYLPIGSPKRYPPGGVRLLYSFADCTLNTDRRELRRNGGLVAVTPQVFDLLQYLICNRERVVTRDDLIAAVWKGRIVSESAL